MMKFYFFITLLLFVITHTSADINKCQGSNGLFYYSNIPCNDEELSEAVELKPNNSYKAPTIHYNFESANYKSKAYQTINNVSNKYACSKLCFNDSNCVVASFYNKHSKKNKRFQCKLRKKLKNKHVGTSNVDSWVK